MPILGFCQKDGGEVPAQEMLKDQQRLRGLALGCAPIPKPSAIVAELKLPSRSSWSLVLEVLPSPPALGFAQIKNLLLTERKLPAPATAFEGIQHVLMSVCFQRCFACSSLHMRNEISWGKKGGCRVAARIVSSYFLSLLASKAEFESTKAELVSSQLRMILFIADALLRARCAGGDRKSS